MKHADAHDRPARPGWLDAIGRDAGYALRSFARHPAFAAVVILTLALGIGADTGIFSAVEGVLLRPVPAPALDRLVVIKEDIHKLDLLDAEFSPAEVVDLIARRDLFETGGGYATAEATLNGVGDPKRLTSVGTIGEFFSAFGQHAYLGRLYGPDDSRPGSPKVVVLAYAAWRDIFGADPALVSRSINLDGTTATVVGVLPPEFRFPRSAQYFEPIILRPQDVAPEHRGDLYVTPVFRAGPNMTLDRLSAGLRDEVAHWAQRFPTSMYDKRFVLRPVPFVDFVAGALRPILLVLLGAVGLVLLIACANVASLQLLRAASRTRETAVRAALGAGRLAAVRQSLTESVLLALAGGVAGVGLGQVFIKLLGRGELGQYQLLRDVHLDGRVLGATAAVSLFAGIVFGIAPALRAAGVSLQEVLREAGRGSSLGARQHRVLQTTVVVQIALTLILLLGSALTIHSLVRLLDTDPGFRPRQVTTMRLAPATAHYGTRSTIVALYTELRGKLEAIPSVESVGFTWGLPFTTTGTSSPFTLADQPVQPGEPARHANMRAVGGDYFRAMGIPVLMGRVFLPTDNDTNQVNVVVDEDLAKQFFHGQNPVGRRISQGRDATIIGVVGNVAGHELGEPLHATVYYNHPQFLVWSMYVAIRSALPPASVIAQTRAVLRDVDPAIAVYDVRTMSDRIAASLGARRLAMVVLTGFAALSLLLAALGIYGVLSYTTAQRTREIGIRMALGADARGVVHMIVRGGLLLGGTGILIGFAVFAGIGRTLASSSALHALLYGVGLWDPITTGIAFGLVAVAVVVACWLPARRAARLDPVYAMRNE